LNSGGTISSSYVTGGSATDLNLIKHAGTLKGACVFITPSKIKGGSQPGAAFAANYHRSGRDYQVRPLTYYSQVSQ